MKWGERLLAPRFSLPAPPPAPEPLGRESSCSGDGGASGHPGPAHPPPPPLRPTPPSASCLQHCLAGVDEAEKGYDGGGMLLLVGVGGGRAGRGVVWQWGWLLKQLPGQNIFRSCWPPQPCLPGRHSGGWPGAEQGAECPGGGGRPIWPPPPFGLPGAAAPLPPLPPPQLRPWH